MKSHLIDLQCGDINCSPSKGKFCRLHRTDHSPIPGVVEECILFNKKLTVIKPWGWIKRLPECLEMEVKND